MWNRKFEKTKMKHDMWKCQTDINRVLEILNQMYENEIWQIDKWLIETRCFAAGTSAPAFVLYRIAAFRMALCHCVSFLIVKFGNIVNCWRSKFKVLMFDFQLLSFQIVVFVCLIFKFEIQRHVFRILISEQILPILRLRHPRLRSFSIASRCFESRWVHSVLVCFTWFCSASCRVDFNYVVLLCSFF